MILAEQLTNKSQMQKLYVEKAPWKPSKELKVRTVLPNIFSRTDIFAICRQANIMYSAGSLLLSSKTPAYRASSVIKALSVSNYALCSFTVLSNLGLGCNNL